MVGDEGCQGQDLYTRGIPQAFGEARGESVLANHDCRPVRSEQFEPLRRRIIGLKKVGKGFDDDNPRVSFSHDCVGTCASAAFGVQLNV